jgi:hypothetical protein
LLTWIGFSEATVEIRNDGGVLLEHLNTQW